MQKSNSYVPPYTELIFINYFDIIIQLNTGHKNILEVNTTQSEMSFNR